MGDSLESNSLTDEAIKKESKTLFSNKITEIHPLAFTIEFDDPKCDESRKSKVRERLSAFTLRHRRNPSLPDFREVKNDKSCAPIEKDVSPVISQHVPVLHKRTEKFGKTLETQWKSTALKAAKNIEFKTPFSFRPQVDRKDNFVTSFKTGRRYSLDGIDDCKSACQKGNIDGKSFENGPAVKKDDTENKSDTISEAGTYTVDKDDDGNGDDDDDDDDDDDGGGDNDGKRTSVLQGNEHDENGEILNGVNDNYHSNWINDWVRDVEEQNLLNPSPKEPPLILFRSLENGNDSCAASKIPSPVNTLNRKAKPRSTKPGDGNKLNGSAFHRRSSSLSAKDYNENHGSESSLDTESFLKATESVMTSMQNRMKLSLGRGSPDLRRGEKRNFNYKERPHPPSTASDTDTNSETDAKNFEKPIGRPFTSARLNRAFSLRRAKADPEKDLGKGKPLAGSEIVNSKQASTSKAVTAKPPSSAPFSRLDCGRFSMRSTASGIRQSTLASQVQKKEAKKSNGGNRSTSSLSSREVEFQNWRRRKSFDPMKAAAEGRKKELAKKAAMTGSMTGSMTQSVNLGGGTRTRSGGGHPVSRSASFHSTVQVPGGEDGEGEEFLERCSTDDQESASCFHPSNRPSQPRNSPSQRSSQSKNAMSTSAVGSRSSLVSETHSSPGRRLRTNDLENLVLGAITEASFKLKLKSCRLLKKLNYLYDPAEEKSFRLRDEIAVLESGHASERNSPTRQTTSRDLSAVLKNLKGVENVFNVLEDILFEENLQIYLNK